MSINELKLKVKKKERLRHEYFVLTPHGVIKIKSLSYIIKQGESQSVTIDTEEIKTQVTIAAGETIVLGGIFQHQKQRSNDRVSLLTDIPLVGVVGVLFKHQ